LRQARISRHGCKDEAIFRGMVKDLHGKEHDLVIMTSELTVKDWF
jgi:hypothetical protein